MESMRNLLPFVGAALAAYLALCAWAFATQRSQIYFPTPAVNHRAPVLWVDSQGERIKVWSVRRPGSRALVYFGGNAEDVGANLDEFAAAFPSHSLYLVNYRGYGGSSGRPTEAALVADALAVFDQVRATHRDVAAMGRSLGSGVAIQLAAARPVQRLVLVTPYDSLASLGSEYFRWLPVRLLLRDRYESARHASQVTVPTLLVIAAEDEIIPMRRSRALADALDPGQASVLVIDGVGHNTLDLSPEYLRAVGAFLRTPPDDPEA
jgi:pimeloyl-ACP methyl ester carboxylesterase